LAKVRVKVNGKGKVHRTAGHEGPEGKWRYSSTLSLASALDAGGWSTPRTRRFTPGKDPVPVIQAKEAQNNHSPTLGLPYVSERKEADFRTLNLTELTNQNKQSYISFITTANKRNDRVEKGGGWGTLSVKFGLHSCDSETQYELVWRYTAELVPSSHSYLLEVVFGYLCSLRLN